jgi:ribosomal protein S6
MSTTEDRLPLKNTRDKEEFQVYELAYLILPSIPEDNLSETVNTIKKIITKAGGKEIDGESPHKREIAYEMRKVVGSSRYQVNEAYFGWIKFESSPIEIIKIKAEVERIEEVLRSLVTKAPRQTYFTFAEALAKKVKETESMEEIEGQEVAIAPIEILPKDSKEEVLLPEIKEVVE